MDAFFGGNKDYGDDTVVLRDLLSVLRLWHNGTLETPGEVASSYTRVRIHDINKRLLKLTTMHDDDDDVI